MPSALCAICGERCPPCPDCTVHTPLPGSIHPVALGLTPLPKGTTSKDGGRCPGKPHAGSHWGLMHIGEDVQEPNPLQTCPEQASALLHPHFCRHPRCCAQQRPGCDIPVLQQELLSLCYDEQTSGLPRASTCLGGKSRSRTPGKYRFSNKNSSPSAVTSRLAHCRRHPLAWVGSSRPSGAYKPLLMGHPRLAWNWRGLAQGLGGWLC